MKIHGFLKNDLHFMADYHGFPLLQVPEPLARMESFRVKLALKFISLVRYPRQDEQV